MDCHSYPLSREPFSRIIIAALLCAREQTSSFSQNGKGLQSGGPPLVVYASDQGHSSIEKAALLAGFGKAYLRLLPTDENHAFPVLHPLADAGIPGCKLAKASSPGEGTPFQARVYSLSPCGRGLG